MPSLLPAGALAAALALSVLCDPAPAQQVTLRIGAEPAFQHAASPADLVGPLDDWLDGQLDYPRRPPPRIEIIDAAQALALEPTVGRMAGRLRGLYDPDAGTIFLVRPWSMDDPRDISVLLHELVHHRQTDARHFYCPGAQEPEAYTLQEAWLAERGLSIAVNRIAVVLAAGCTRTDFHPD
jgi:hypothetical protein